MQPRLTLAYYDDDGRFTRVSLSSRRFTIGRESDNDLAIDHSSLSRYHALIEDFDNTFRISDCGSTNGTFVNGNRVQLPVELSDGDVINLADICEIEVEMDKSQPDPLVNEEWRNESQPLSHEAMRALDRNLSARSTSRMKGRAGSMSTGERRAGILERMDLRIILPAVTLIMLVVVVAIALKGSASNQNASDNRIILSRGTPEFSPRVQSSIPQQYSPPAESPSLAPSPNELDDELDEVEKNTLAVMRAISLRDSNPVLTQTNDQEIYEKVKLYKGSTTLRENFRLIKSGIPQLTPAAKASGVKMPLLVFAALARVNKDGHGDPVVVARGLINELARNQIFLAKDMAHDNLLAVAATDPGSGGALALRDAIAGASKSRNQGVQTIRNVWYLRDIGILRPSAFDLVMRFLAIGAIAQNPRHYGIDAEPMTF